MPVINMPLDLLLRMVNSDGAVIDETRVPQTLHDMGIEVDELTTTRSFACGVCENVSDRTDAQGAPLHCAKCGTDFRERPADCRELGQNKVARLDMLAVRPDIFDAGGMARYMRGFLGARTGLIEYPVVAAAITVQVDPQLSRDESYRPCIACAVLRNVTFNNERIKLLMGLQEDLHWALGRDRKLASIGVYDLDALRPDGRPFQYRAVQPNGVRFVPLGYAPADPAANMTPAEILERHKTGRAYAHLLRGLAAYPLLEDGHGTVLSMPPIINSEATRVTMKTRQCFVDVTGLAQRTVDRALNILVSGLKEAIPELQIEAVIIEHADARLRTPDFSPMSMTLDVQAAADTIGVPLDAAGLTQLLERMGHGVSVPHPDDRSKLTVAVPAWRNDVMHAVDLIEDAAIAYGYDRLIPALVPTFSVGAPRAIEERSAVARRILTGLGFHQVMTLTLVNLAADLEKWRLAPGDARAAEWGRDAVQIENPISSEQTHCRVSLLPGLLHTLSLNKQYDLPQHIFEVGDCCRVDAAAETGAREERYVAAAMIGTHIGYADIRAVLDSFVHESGVECTIRPVEHPSFIVGRVAGIHDAGGRSVGTLGELHPEVLERYGLRHAAAVLELNFAGLIAAGSNPPTP